jgi:3-hydroxyacyl-CoA dehydrogenase/enoyl-CoA hydratase/3-hydroxybutyryl-CoA epimerase
MDRLAPDVQGRCVHQADVVIEAIFEDVSAKQTLFSELEPKLKAHALLATNTSSIRLEVLGEVLHRPERIVGLHFFNPVAKMPLVEIIKTDTTDAEAIKQAEIFAGKIDRLPLPVNSSPGFLVNRVLMPYLLEAVQLVQEGVPAAVIDKAATDFGMPMGPIRLADAVGLDICLSVANILAEKLETVVPDRLSSLVNQGKLGVKSGQGFYQYKGGKLVREKLDKNYKQPDNITDRLIMSFLNEAVTCLREGVIEDNDLLDAGIIFGTGFAPFRGGPMQYIDASGAAHCMQKLESLEKEFGSRFTSDIGWNRLVMQ